MIYEGIGPAGGAAGVMTVSGEPGNIDALAIRRRLGVSRWGVPKRFGDDGWLFTTVVPPHCRIIVTCADHGDDREWVHASICRTDDVPAMPTYADLKLLHGAVFGDGWAYQVFAPPSEHVNIHAYVLHLFGRLDGRPSLPDFTCGTGSI